MSEAIEEEAGKRNYTKPYGGKHPIPTVQGYRAHRKEIEEQLATDQEVQHTSDDGSRTKRAYNSAKTILQGNEEQGESSRNSPYPVSNHNDQKRARQRDVKPQHAQSDVPHDHSTEEQHKQRDKDKSNSATEQASGAIDPRQKRKAMKKAKRTGGRQVTDPVTHLPIVIYDQTSKTLESMPENEPNPGSHSRTATGLHGASKSESELADEQGEQQRRYNGLQKAFPPPNFQDLQEDLATIYKFAVTTGLSIMLLLAVGSAVAMTIVTSSSMQTRSKSIVMGVVVLFIGAAGGICVYLVSGWLENKSKGIFDDRIWEALRDEEQSSLADDSELPESVQWLNSTLTSVWPLINPDLFTSLVDTLEDVMQASLPKIVRMVSIDDMGQGSEALRILGINWLPTGAASQSVDEHGNLKSRDEKAQSDRVAPGEGQQDPSVEDGDGGGSGGGASHDDDAEPSKQQEESEQAIRAGMEAEEGDFVNMELAFAYRARTSGRSIKSKAKNAHLYLKFYFPGGLAVPVWVELRGITGIMRLRLQLTPDPPFFSICTFTFLGQPKADLSCVPLSKHSLNVMDIPLISSFVQSSIDAALAEYVAPKSMTLDLKDMLMGEDFKKDTSTRGVVWIYIKHARDFKQGDGGIGPMQGSSDSYVSVSWGKFGKPVASTRIIVNDQSPNWHEWASILVSADEINATEKLKLQLWDSDKWTADDDLGRVEVDLGELMHNSETKNKMCDREDRFMAADVDENMPGTLTWSVGYFEKTRITQQQLEQQTARKNIRNKDAMRKYIEHLSQNKLREAKLDGDHSDELHQQQVQDFKELEDDMLISAPPSHDHVSGVLSVQIHNITGLEIQKQQKQDSGDQDFENEDEEHSDLPDSYCTIILNHRKIFKTRTKPKNAKPFFNAGTERFVKDWTTTEVIVSVRDSREKEGDALLGVVYLPLRKLFEKRSQVMATYPLAGGVGYGRARISLVWRSVELQIPAHLRGWDYGTIEIKGEVRSKGSLDQVSHDRIKLRTNLSRTKMQPQDGVWRAKHKSGDDSVFLAVRSRYASALVVEFRKNTIGPDKTPAFGVLWLSEVVDDELDTKTLTIFKGGKKEMARAESCGDYQSLEGAGEAIGELEFDMRFWRGLSGYHKAHAGKSKNADVRNVMECLDTINDENMADEYSDGEDSDSSDDGEQDPSAVKPSKGKDDSSEESRTREKLRSHTNQSDESAADSDFESNESSGLAKIKAPFSKVKDLASSTTDKAAGDKRIEDDGSRGLRAQVQDYKHNSKQLHRKHRGIMQWKSVRTLDWAGSKVKRAGSRVGEIFEHSEKDQGIETEV